jgi:hypothetical protein
MKFVELTELCDLAAAATHFDSEGADKMQTSKDYKTWSVSELGQRNADYR